MLTGGLERRERTDGGSTLWLSNAVVGMVQLRMCRMELNVTSGGSSASERESR